MSRPLPSRPIIVPVHEVQTYILNGWRLEDEPHCSGAQMVPPEHFLGDDPPPDPPHMRRPPTRGRERAKSQGGVGLNQQKKTTLLRTDLQDAPNRSAEYLGRATG